MPLGFQTWWYISATIDYIDPSRANYWLTDAAHTSMHLVPIIQPEYSFPFRLTGVLLGDKKEHKHAFYFRELRLWSDNYFPKTMREHRLEYLQISGVQEMPVGLLAGWNFDLRNGHMIKSYVGTNYDIPLPQDYINALDPQGSSLLELNPCPFGSVLEGEIASTTCTECANNCYICG